MVACLPTMGHIAQSSFEQTAVSIANRVKTQANASKVSEVNQTTTVLNALAEVDSESYPNPDSYKTSYQRAGAKIVDNLGDKFDVGVYYASNDKDGVVVGGHQNAGLYDKAKVRAFVSKKIGGNQANETWNRLQQDENRIRQAFL